MKFVPLVFYHVTTEHLTGMLFQNFRIGVPVGAKEKRVIRTAIRCTGFKGVRYTRHGSPIGLIAVNLDNGGSMSIKKVGIKK